MDSDGGGGGVVIVGIEGGGEIGCDAGKLLLACDELLLPTRIDIGIP